jgi:RecA/RadA recombinase
MLLMLQTALPRTRNGLDSNVLYLTTVKKLSTKRLEQIIDNLNLSNIERKILMSKIDIRNIEASEFDNFMLQIEEIIFKNKIKMIIIDSIAGLCDVQFINENNEVDYVGRAMFLKRILNQLKQLIYNYNLFFIVTNNVKADIERGSGVRRKNLLYF